ncbi:hypothetical protein [Oceanicoccus sagamiensis]|uniref:Uncharacterized protein n=1 Tax=Oceanicoccus sagamiensis TaxID=716816 RepID=A0A1X9NHY1_9GAMM|nr:hypothetical protein [Oceanicoccus sagamiensis]ARN75119.1 hypothetical protein BST96_13940 [Oceanicoccus sagamiensis]
MQLYKAITQAPLERQPEQPPNEAVQHSELSTAIWADPRSNVDRRTAIDINKVPATGCRRTHQRRRLHYVHTEQWWLQRHYDQDDLGICLKKMDFDDDIFDWLDAQGT